MTCNFGAAYPAPRNKPCVPEGARERDAHQCHSATASCWGRRSRLAACSRPPAKQQRRTVTRHRNCSARGQHASRSRHHAGRWRDSSSSNCASRSPLSGPSSAAAAPSVSPRVAAPAFSRLIAPRNCPKPSCDRRALRVRAARVRERAGGAAPGASGASGQVARRGAGPPMGGCPAQPRWTARPNGCRRAVLNPRLPWSSPAVGGRTRICEPRGAETLAARTWPGGRTRARPNAGAAEAAAPSPHPAAAAAAAQER